MPTGKKKLAAMIAAFGGVLLFWKKRTATPQSDESDKSSDNETS